MLNKLASQAYDSHIDPVRH